MAKQVQVQLIDDIDGSEAVESIAFAFRGAEYEIDLNQKHIGAFEKAVSKFIESARSAAPAKRGRSRSGASSTSGSRRKKGSSAAPTSDIRSWAQANGYEIGDRGRIPGAVRESYEAALG